MTVLFALVTYAVFGVILAITTVLMLVLGTVGTLVDPDRRAAGWVFRMCGTWVPRLTPTWRFRTTGERPGRRQAYVMVANHRSIADIFLLSDACRHAKWLAKESLFKVPLVGTLMHLAGDIPVIRGDASSSTKALEQAKRYLERGISVVVFPEGTRSRDGALLPFKSGAFRLAIETGVPILPIAVEGTSDAMPKGSPWIRRARARACVLPPVETAGLSLDDVPALRDRVRRLIAAQLHCNEAELAGALEPEGSPHRA
jgi:1-acyl-sn-glycerol-3-phosphate acyltransferase